MRAGLGLIALLLALGLVALVAKKALTAAAPPAAPKAPVAEAPLPAGAPNASGQAVQQYRQALESALQAPRPVSDEP